MPGTHVVGLEGPHDAVELRHSARGRGGFARGAVAAAEWIQGRKGFFSIDEMLAERFGIRHTTIQIDRDSSCEGADHPADERPSNR